MAAKTFQVRKLFKKQYFRQRIKNDIITKNVCDKCNDADGNKQKFTCTDKHI